MVSSEFAARLSAEDLNDIAAGDMPLETIQAFEAAAIAREAEDLKEFFEERAGVLVFDAGLPICGPVCEALSHYAALVAHVPDRPLGVAQVAMLKDKARGAQEVKA